MEPKAEKGIWFPVILSVVIHAVLVITVFQVKILNTIFPNLSSSRMIELEKLAQADEERVEQFIRETTTLNTDPVPPQVGASKISGLEFSDYSPSVTEKEIPLKTAANPYPSYDIAGDEALISSAERMNNGSLLPVSKKESRKGGPVVSEGKPGIPLSVLRDPWELKDFESKIEGEPAVIPAYQLPKILEPKAPEVPSFLPPLPDYTKTEKIVSLDKDLDCIIDLYRDQLTNETFFRLMLKLKKQSQMEVFPKDNLFMIDVSSSVKDEELDRVFEAMKKIIPATPQGDRFNVVKFHMKEESLFRGMRQYFGEEHADFINFLQRPERAVLTNLSNTIRRTLLNFPGSPNRPMNVTILTDGKVSAGKTSIAAVTSKYSNARLDNHSIFTFNVGRPANLYMMEMMSYLGKGYTCDCEDENQTSRQLAAFLAQFSRPVLTLCETQYMTPQVSEVYPRELPNLYADNELKIYGKCQQGKEFTFRLKGKGVKETRDFLIRTQLPDPDEKNEEIAREWARGRIYQLIERYIAGEDVLDQVRTLALKYSINLPYNIDER